jgi:glucose-1-phosphate cytidylyltransferase
MKAVIFAGGLGTRIAEESVSKPKPMVEVGGMPLLWHVMKIYSLCGVKEFIVCLGYKGYVIKDYFFNYHRLTADMTIDLATDSCRIHSSRSEDWKVTLVDTGQDTATGGRLKRVERYLDGGTFLATYGDGLSDIDINELLAFHRGHGKPATVTAIQPPGRFGRFYVEDGRVVGFEEKPRGEFGWVNGGYFVFEPEILSRLDRDSGPLEKEFMADIVADRLLEAYQYGGFWMSCDTMRDKLALEKIWDAGDAPWLAAREKRPIGG